MVQLYKTFSNLEVEDQAVVKFFLWGAIVIGIVGFISGFYLILNGDLWGIFSIISSAGLCAIGFIGLTNE